MTQVCFQGHFERILEYPEVLAFCHDLENRLKEEADHFDMQSPITIQVGDKEKIGRIETGHHKMKVSAIYNIKSFEFND